MTRTYTATVVGAGGGGRLSLKALVASPRFKPIGVADISAEARRKIAETFPDLRTFASHSEMFEECPADVVCVSTYAPSHLPITLDALKRPLTGLLVEKPLADTAASGQRLLDAIKESGLPVVVPHGLLVAPHVMEIIGRVHNGEIGDLQLVEIQCRRWDILNAGIHWLNFFVVLTKCEPADYVIAACDTSTRTYRDGLQVETLAVTYAQTRSGVRVVMNTGDDVMISHPDADTLFRLMGSRGTIEFYGWANKYRVLNAEYPDGETFTPKRDDRVNHHQRHLESLAAQMDSGRRDYAVAESSLQALELCEAAYLSHRHRCMVKMPLSDFTPPPADDWDPGRPYSGSGGGRDGRKLD